MLSRLLIRSMVCAVVTAPLASASAETAYPPSSGATFEAALTGSRKSGTEIAPAQSVDLILSFRNVHNWMADDYAPSMFAAFLDRAKYLAVGEADNSVLKFRKP